MICRGGSGSGSGMVPGRDKVEILEMALIGYWTSGSMDKLGCPRVSHVLLANLVLVTLRRSRPGMFECIVVINCLLFALRLVLWVQVLLLLFVVVVVVLLTREESSLMMSQP